MEGCEKSLDRDGNSMTDRISDLPDCLIDCILDRLSFADAVKTCVLSKRWSYCWTRVKRIVFDWELNVTHKKSVDEIIKLNDIINSILLRHDGPIDEFYVIGYIDRDPLYRMPTTEENECIHRWMQLLLGNGIRRLTFSVVNPNCSTLTHLSLTRCKLGHQQDFMGVGYLGYLCLSGVSISARLLETVITSFAHLEVLILEYLLIDFDGDDNGGVIVINAPVLKELQVMQYNLPIILKETPHLTWADVQFIVEVPMGTKTAKINYFARMMPRIEILKIIEESFASLASDDTPMKLPFMLHNLKDLQISSYHNFSFTKMACFFCLIRSSPNLESLYISVRWDPSFIDDEYLAAAVKFYEAQENEGGTLSRLSNIKFDNLEGNVCEVEFISRLVDWCPMLETVSISPVCYILQDTEEWLFKELMNRMGSKSATVKMEFQFQSQWNNKKNTAPPGE